ncbi:hypothetical protein HGRIS_003646 [Hohenbuehelia grisea]|uniref:Nudix hydrolase domain-containing protein n=1 Tax=Hohenbuehelia grisea TaxID=104357 RepID=A0ABR3JGP4_9AGAR
MKLPTIHPTPVSALDSLTEKTRQGIERLNNYTPQESPIDFPPQTKLASVLVLLYERAGGLRVLLTTRSKALRTHAGQTALPGGKVDETDVDLAHTALREAHEEVALPMKCPHIHPLCFLEPFISLHGLLVTPVVALLTELAVLDQLKASEHEVDAIFDHPLEAILDPSLARGEPLADAGGENWPYTSDVHDTTDSQVTILNNHTYRMHRFRSVASPIKGLTADILIKVAEITYGKGTVYERFAPGQIHGYEAVAAVMGSSNQSHNLPSAYAS